MHDPVTLVGHNAPHDALRRLGPPRDRAPAERPTRCTRALEPTAADAATRQPEPPAYPRGSSNPGDALPEVEVRISKRRKKTSEAKWVGGRIVVSLPAHLDGENRQKTIDWLVDRLLTRHRLQSGLGDDGSWPGRSSSATATSSAPAPPPSAGSPTRRRGGDRAPYYSGDIRVSHRLRVVPEWVLDSVLVHEVAHLTHPDHSPAFHALAGAYPRHEEAGVFLAGYGLGLSNPPP